MTALLLTSPNTAAAHLEKKLLMEHYTIKAFVWSVAALSNDVQVPTLVQFTGLQEAQRKTEKRGQHTLETANPPETRNNIILRYVAQPALGLSGFGCRASLFSINRKFSLSMSLRTPSRIACTTTHI